MEDAERPRTINSKPPPSDTVIVLPVRKTVLFPGIVLPLAITGRFSPLAAHDAVRNDRMPVIILQTDPEIEDPAPDQLYQIGTLARVLRFVTTPEGAHHLVVQGVRRIRLLDFPPGFPFLVAHFEEIDDTVPITAEIRARIDLVKLRSREAIELLPNVPPEVSEAIDNIDSASALADYIAGIIDAVPSEKQQLLETIDIRSRFDKLLVLISQRIEVLKLTKTIGEKTQHSLSSQQREHILREQLRHIQKELGEDDEKSTELVELRTHVVNAGMPAETEEQANKELTRLERMSDASPEYGMVRGYLDWLINLPWSKLDADAIDLAEARRILDEDHYGLPKIKRRILEYLAVRKLNPEGRSPILCFVGPPGVGKTSLGQSIAKAVRRKFVRLSLGGVHDEAEIRGHRRTYIGALPGNIIQSIRKAGSRNPVMMLDEVDKLGSGAHGDPSAALLEVLDPEQNSMFRDNYLGVPFDLSKVIFIATANMLDTIPGPVRDRMEVIELPGYTEDEKLEIARRYLVERQLKASGLTRANCEITENALRSLIRDYTREAGVRNLERAISSVCRHVAMSIADGSAMQIKIEEGDLANILGPRRFEKEVAMRTSVAGVATGLAWTPTGGDILFIEATRVPGRGHLILTGQLGDVMKESAQAALTLTKGRAPSLGIKIDLFEKSDIHVHVPAGAIPKDGPSAGVAMFVALVSLLTGRIARSDTAMTGEISLRGLILPIGGVKEKVLAAARAGILTVLLPSRNRIDLEDVPESSRALVRIVWLDQVDEAVSAALIESNQTKGADVSQVPGPSRMKRAEALRKK